MSDCTCCALQVDLRIFELAVVQLAAYHLLPAYEFDLHAPDGPFLGVTMRPMAGSGPLPPDADRQFQRELTRAAMERQAHADHRHLRTWFAVAAMATEVPAEQVLAELEQDLAIAEPVAAAADLCEVTCTTRGEEALYHVAPGCPVRVVVRALSRLHDVADSVIEGYDSLGGLGITVRLSPGVDPDWWEERFRSLLPACADGGLPALYPPAFSLDQMRL